MNPLEDTITRRDSDIAGVNGFRSPQGQLLSPLVLGSPSSVSGQSNAQQYPAPNSAYTNFSAMQSALPPPDQPYNSSMGPERPATRTDMQGGHRPAAHNDLPHQDSPGPTYYPSRDQFNEAPGRSHNWGAYNPYMSLPDTSSPHPQHWHTPTFMRSPMGVPSNQGTQGSILGLSANGAYYYSPGGSAPSPAPAYYLSPGGSAPSPAPAPAPAPAQAPPPPPPNFAAEIAALTQAGVKTFNFVGICGVKTDGPMEAVNQRLTLSGNIQQGAAQMPSLPALGPSASTGPLINIAKESEGKQGLKLCNMETKLSLNKAGQWTQEGESEKAPVAAPVQEQVGSTPVYLNPLQLSESSPP